MGRGTQQWTLCVSRSDQWTVLSSSICNSTTTTRTFGIRTEQRTDQSQTTTVSRINLIHSLPGFSSMLHYFSCAITANMLGIYSSSLTVYKLQNVIHLAMNYEICTCLINCSRRHIPLNLWCNGVLRHHAIRGHTRRRRRFQIVFYGSTKRRKLETETMKTPVRN